MYKSKVTNPSYGITIICFTTHRRTCIIGLIFKVNSEKLDNTSNREINYNHLDQPTKGFKHDDNQNLQVVNQHLQIITK